jgi:hypothetical protein
MQSCRRTEREWNETAAEVAVWMMWCKACMSWQVRIGQRCLMMWIGCKYVHVPCRFMGKLIHYNVLPHLHMERNIFKKFPIIANCRKHYDNAFHHCFNSVLHGLFTLPCKLDCCSYFKKMTEPCRQNIPHIAF